MISKITKIPECIAAICATIAANQSNASNNPSESERPFVRQTIMSGRGEDVPLPGVVLHANYADNNTIDTVEVSIAVRGWESWRWDDGR